MKFLKSLILALVLGVTMVNVADAGSIGRSSSSSSSFSSGRSSSSSSFSSPSRSSSFSAPAPSKPSGIGGTASMGVSKPSVTDPVRPSAPAPSYGSVNTPSTTPHYAPSPSYGTGYTPAPSVVHHDSFGSSMGGSFVGSMFGSMVGNSLSRPAAAPVVVNGGGGTVVSNGSGQVVSSGETIVSNNGSTQVITTKSSYGIGSFIMDVILFAILIAVVVGLCVLLYKGLKMLKSYVNDERGIDNNPFAPTERFWIIQKAFGAADKGVLTNLLGPDLKDEVLDNITPCEIAISKVSHEVRLLNNREFSVLYKFVDEGSDIAQVWHYEKFGTDWKLNGIETI